MALDEQLSEFLVSTGAPQIHCVLLLTVGPPTLRCLTGGQWPLMFTIVYRYITSPKVRIHDSFFFHDRRISVFIHDF